MYHASRKSKLAVIGLALLSCCGVVDSAEKIVAGRGDAKIQTSAIALSDCGESIVSKTAKTTGSVSTANAVGTDCPVSPSVPARITYPSTSTTGTDAIVWEASSNATSYVLEVSQNGAAFVIVQSIKSSSYLPLTYTPATARANGTYIYRVKACDQLCSDYLVGNTMVVSIPPTIATFSASPTQILSGANTTLTWSSSNASSCSLAGATVAVSGSKTFSGLTATTAYTLNCSGSGGSTSATTTVTVLPPPTIAAFSASPTLIAQGGSSTLSWSTSNATSCTLAGSSVGVNSSKTFSNIAATTTYALSCSGAGGSVSASITVAVHPKITSFTVSPTQIAAGGNSTLTWAATNASACSVNGTAATSPFTVNTINATTTYTLTCTGAAGTTPATATATVTVVPPPTVSISPSPATITKGGSSKLSWSSTNATSCTINGAAVSGSSKDYTNIQNTTSYTLSCSGIGGTRTASTTVTVVPPPAAPTNLQTQANSQRVWVLIHADVPFLVPSYLAAGEGSATVSWNAVTGAIEYRYRVFVDGQWSNWISVGANTFANVSNAGSGDVMFEVVACDAYGCSSSCDSSGCMPVATSTTIVVSMWQNVGLCDPITGKQKQRCIDGRYCTVDSIRELEGVCSQNVKPCGT